MVLHRHFDRGSARRAREDLPALLAALELRPGLRCLDAGGGTGAVAALLAQAVPGCVWWVVDPAGRRARFGLGAHPGIAFVLGDTQALPIRAARIDRALVSVALHHVPDQAAALHELRRVLAPGGLLVVLEMDPASGPGPLVAWFERNVLRNHSRFLSPQELCGMLEQAGFADLRARPARRGYLATARRP